MVLDAGLDAGLDAVSTASELGTAWDGGLEEGALAIDAGLAYEIKHQMSQKYDCKRNRTFFSGGSTASSASPASPFAISSALRLLPRGALEPVSLSPFFSLRFLSLAGRSLAGRCWMREERRGGTVPDFSAAPSGLSDFALRGIVERGRKIGGKGVKMGVRERRVSETQIIQHQFVDTAKTILITCDLQVMPFPCSRLIHAAPLVDA